MPLQESTCSHGAQNKILCDDLDVRSHISSNHLQWGLSMSSIALIVLDTFETSRNLSANQRGLS